MDNDTLQITLSEPYAPFIRMLGNVTAKIIPREDVERLGDRFGRQPVGTGPFRFVEWKTGQEIILEANETYFDERPCLDRLQYRIFPGDDREAMLAAFDQRQLEDTPIPESQRQRLLGDSRYRFFRKPLLSTLFLWFDMRTGPLRHLKVRQAINLAINREAINGTIRQHRHVQAQGILPPGMPGYNPALPGYDYDLARARQLLAAAGYAGGKGMAPLELWSSMKSLAALAEDKAIQHDLKQLGITLELHYAESWSQFKTEILRKRPGAIYRLSWHAGFPDPDIFLYFLFYSQSTYNYSYYDNPEVDRLLREARSEDDYLRRLELYRKSEKLILDAAPAVNLIHYAFEHLFQPYVRGVVVNALGEPYIPMKHIWLDTPHHACPKTDPSK